MAAVAPPDRDPLDDLDLPRLVAAMIVEAIVSYAAWRRRLGRGTVDRPSHVERAGKAAEAFLYGAGAMRQSRHGLLAYLGFAPEAADAALHRLRDDPERLAEIERFVKSMQCQKSQIGTQERRERREAQHDDYE